MSTMSERDAGKADALAHKKGPQRVVPTTKVNVAFPFSQIKIQEPSEHLKALASLVAELAEFAGRAAPGPEADELRLRAHDLADRLT
jgi:hypothetical protein